MEQRLQFLTWNNLPLLFRSTPTISSLQAADLKRSVFVIFWSLSVLPWWSIISLSQCLWIIDIWHINVILLIYSFIGSAVYWSSTLLTHYWAILRAVLSILDQLSVPFHPNCSLLQGKLWSAVVTADASRTWWKQAVDDRAECRFTQLNSSTQENWPLHAVYKGDCDAEGGPGGMLSHPLTSNVEMQSLDEWAKGEWNAASWGCDQKVMEAPNWLN